LADGAVLHRESDGAGNHFEIIAQLVAELLSAAGVAATELKYIRVGVGPGSFTGLRIGLSYAKGMSMAAQVPLIGVCSFAGVAHSVAARDGVPSQQILVVADARREEVFWAQYSLDTGGIVTQVQEPCIRSLPEVWDWRAEHPRGVICTPSNGFQIPQVGSVQVESRIAEGLLRLDGGLVEPFSTVRVAELEPNYLRAVAAKSIEERKGS